MLSYIIAYLTHKIMEHLHGRRTIVIGTRESVLALAQTHIVHQYLLDNFPDIDVKLHSLSTSGDKNQIQPLHEMARKALWTEELEDLLLEGKVDLIVHSLKDMPTTLPATCQIGAILEREDPRDALVVRPDLPYRSLGELPAGSVVGTSSVRRMAQISRLYPSLILKDMRGNVPRRLEKLKNHAEFGFDALILAAAGLHRLNFHDQITAYLESPEMLHAVGQGAIAVETRENDPEIAALIKGLNHHDTAKACIAERALLRKLEGGCSVPIGVETSFVGEELKMKAVVLSVDGTQIVETEVTQRTETEDAADQFGREVADKLVELGCQPILVEVEKKRAEKAAADVKRNEEGVPIAINDDGDIVIV